ncbi:MAG: hypothetical protein J6S57_01660 [Alphaproteobacteria bacterium]|nr:hypothetical protein [Alphaproteobacteria bacterium]
MKVFLCLCSGLMVVHVANADEVIVWSESQNVDEFTGSLNRILDGVVLTAVADNCNISVLGGMTIENYGTINGNLVTDNDNWIYINNTGVINGHITAEHVVQIITSGAGAQQLNINSNDFFVRVNGAMDGVLLNDIKNLGSQSVEFSGSKIIIDNFSDWQNWNANVSWGAVINTFVINDVHTINPDVYLRHISGATELNFLVSNEEKLYRIDSEYDEYGVKLIIVRETDYQRIFDDNRGLFLENLRINNPNDKLLLAMDKATSMDDLQNIMHSSYRFNSGVLIRPIKSLNNFLMVEDWFNDNQGAGVIPFYTVSKDMNSFGARAYTNIKYNEYQFNFGLHFNEFNYEDDINVFGGSSYGANIEIKKQVDKFFVLGHLGFDFILFDADNIYTDNEIKNNPNGYALYGGIDGIYDYSISKNLVVSPFVGTMLQQFSVLDFSENDINFRGGGIAKYNFTVDGIKYEYGALCGVVTNGDVFADFKVGFESLIDNAGLSIKIGAYKDENLISYRASINANILF